MVHILKDKEKHFVSKEKREAKQKKRTDSANDGSHHSHPRCVEDRCLGIFPALEWMWEWWQMSGIIVTEICKDLERER
jgi:hypothetical protein